MQVGTIWVHQNSAQECYPSTLAMEREETSLVGASLPEVLDGEVDCSDLKLGVDNEILTLTKDLKEVKIAPQPIKCKR